MNVTHTDGTHLQNFPIDKFDTLFRTEESGFRHFENVVGRE
jgi:hypothetical protein